MTKGDVSKTDLATDFSELECFAVRTGVYFLQWITGAYLKSTWLCLLSIAAYGSFVLTGKTQFRYGCWNPTVKDKQDTIRKLEKKNLKCREKNNCTNGINSDWLPHLRASLATASELAAAASAASSAAVTAAAAALFRVASNLWIAEASAVGLLPLPVGETFCNITVAH